MSQRVETLDELIDRVSADLTQAPNATGFGEEVAARLDRPRSIETWMPAASLAAITLVVIGVLLSRQPSPVPLARKTNSTPAPVVQTPSRDVPTPVRTEARVQLTRPRSAARTATEGGARINPPTMIAALPFPALQAVDQLSVDELAVPRVEIDQLDVSTLAIDDLTIDSDSKEQHP